jgi:hypothetical protein
VVPPAIGAAPILLAIGVRDSTVLDSRGILLRERADVTGKAALVEITNPRRVAGGPPEALVGQTCSSACRAPLDGSSVDRTSHSGPLDH